MMVVGITGSIGSGKSEVAKVFAENGAVVIDADREAKDLLRKGEEGYEAIVREFGEEILNEKGEINRHKLASRVFGDRDRVERVNQLIHPLLHKRIVDKLRSLGDQPGRDVAVIDAPLLIEAGYHTMVDYVILVIPGSPQEAIQRAARRIGISQEEVKRRLSFQMPQAEKEKMADITIINDGTLDALYRKAQEVWKRMLKKEDRGKE